MIGMIGPDGVGKSTLLAMMAGVRKIQIGKVEVLGGDIADAKFRNVGLRRASPTCRRDSARISIPRCRSSRTSTSSADCSASRRRSASERIDDLLDSTDLTPFRERPAGKLSGGMKQKLGLCCSLIHDPDLLILDEPTTGVDPLARRQFWELIDRIRLRRPHA